MTYPGVATNDIAGMQAAVGVLQSKWSVAILAELADGTHRFNELLRKIDGSPGACSPPPCAGSSRTA